MYSIILTGKGIAVDTLTVTFKTVTPLFLGGAGPTERAEFRAPSIKGALRFWYRATDPDYRSHEGRIFGSTDTGQAAFSIRIAPRDIRRGAKGDDRWNNKKTAYLGFGLINRVGGKFVTVREYIQSKSTFDLSLSFGKMTNGRDRTKIEQALWALTSFGGLGARSRKGFGSLEVLEIKGHVDSSLIWTFDNSNALSTAVSDYIWNLPQQKDMPEFTAFSEKCRCVVTKECGDGEQTLEWLANELQGFRSFRSKNRASIVKNDHDIMVKFLKTGEIAAPPKRAAFGLPHNYYFTRSLDRIGGEINYMDGTQKGRRASPMLLHVHGLTNGKACVVATFLPAPLIPKGHAVVVEGNSQRQRLPLPDDFSAVEMFMDHLLKFKTGVR